MQAWRRLRGAFRSAPTFVFAMGLGFLAALAAGPIASIAIATTAMTVLQIVSKTATGNWFPDRFERSGLLRYDPARTQSGYTLYTVAPDLSAHLIDMDGRELHRWFVPKEQAMPGTNGLTTLFGLLAPQVEGGYLYPNGDLIMVYEVKALDFPATLLVKLDKDSHVLWRTEVKVHHAIEVVGDNIYALTGRFGRPSRMGDPNLAGMPNIDECVTVIAPDGVALSTHSIFDAIVHTKGMHLTGAVPAEDRIDGLHSNSLDVLTAQTARFIPGAKPGNVLLSLRSLDMLVVMDLESDTIVWALRGGWRKQHDAKMLPNGHILLFDNDGGLMKHGRSRILEIDPQTAGIVWSYDGSADDALDSGDNRGGAQRLANGNTLINESDAGRLLEVTPDGSVVWEYVNPIQTEEHGKKIIASFGLTVSRYASSAAPFLANERSHEAIR